MKRRREREVCHTNQVLRYCEVVLMLGIIPAAGRGTRLRPVTDYIPKELMMYGDKPILGHIMHAMKSVGIKRVAIVIGHKKGTIIDYIKDGKDFGVSVDYIYQREPKGLGHAIYITKDRIEDSEEIFILLGDTIIDPTEEISKMIEEHRKNTPFATIMVEKVKDPERYGVVKMKGDKVVDLYEKPDTEEIKKEYEINGWWYAIAGVYILDKGIYEYLEKIPPGRNNEIQLTDALKLAVEDKRDVRAYVLNGKRIDIGTMETYLEAQKYWFSKYMSD